MRCVLGAHGLSEIVESRRIVGFARERTMQLAPSKGANTFTCAELGEMEERLIHQAGDSFEMIILGAVLILTLFRARFADLEHITLLTLDGNFLTEVASQTKTSGRSGDRLPLEMLGPARLFSKTDWFPRYAQFRVDNGIPLGAWPILPTRRYGKWFPLHGCLEDFNAALRHIASNLGLHRAAERSSHGCKATLLSIMAKAGEKPGVRAALGHHAVKGESSSV